MNRLRCLSVALALAGAVGCRPDDQRTDTIDPQDAMQKRENLPPEVAAQLDSGSVAFRADDLETALEHYERAAELGPRVAAAWFGVYMAQHGLGDERAAEEALERAREVAPGATLIHPAGSDTVR